ncbi:hypothetical protein EV127DRAFT_408349 [Xylaria flabelliformis]|nr:hypothetical protein EV127DRAFT_408349 [Xylaria flabelliformis]
MSLAAEPRSLSPDEPLALSEPSELLLPEVLPDASRRLELLDGREYLRSIEEVVSYYISNQIINSNTKTAATPLRIAPTWLELGLDDFGSGATVTGTSVEYPTPFPSVNVSMSVVSGLGIVKVRMPSEGDICLLVKVIPRSPRLASAGSSHLASYTILNPSRRIMISNHDEVAVEPPIQPSWLPVCLVTAPLSVAGTSAPSRSVWSSLHTKTHQPSHQAPVWGIGLVYTL